ncbi:porin, partial [Nitratireductor indicus C115]
YDYTPNVVGKIGLTQGWGSVAGFVAYDATAEEWALKGFASIKATQQLTVELLATYSSDPNVYTNFNYDYSFGGYLKYAATPKLSVGLGGQYFGDRQSSSALLSGNDDWAIGGVVDYKVVENFNTKLALNYNDGDSYSDGVFSGFIRFERGF